MRAEDLYSEGLRIAETIRDLDGPNVNPLCASRLYTHGKRVARSLVLLHGFTNCPQQMDALGRQFHERGWNVFIPRYPRHGYKDRLTTSISELREEHLLAVANRAAEVGAGLGDQMTVAGLSLGAILTGLLAHSRADIARAVLIAPGPFTAVMSHVADRLPNFYLWWDRSRKEQAAPPYGYPRFSTHAYAAQLHAGRRLVRAARRESPLSRSLVVITNADGPRLGNLLVRPWRDHGADVQTHELSVDEDMLPDLASIIEGVPANFA